jgi:membrane protein implicated in regulation of membrane protease activity
MSLDIRVPTGFLFLIIGALLVVFGLVSDPAIYKSSLDININLWWGLVLVAFSGVMLASAWIAAKKPQSPSESPTDQKGPRGH